MIAALRQRQEWQFFGVLHRADLRLAVAWWLLLALRGLLPAGFAVAMGLLVSAVQGQRPLVTPLVLVAVIFGTLQVLTPIHQAVSANLGDRTSAWLYDRLTEACVRPPGMGHLEDPKLARDMTTARDFDLGTTGPPLSLSLDFIAGGLVELLAGVASAVVLFGFAWWAPLVLAGAWLATHWLLRESGVWKDRQTEQVRAAQQYSDYAYRLAVDAPAAKEIRLFGLVGWVIDSFTRHRTVLHDLQYRATRMREKSVLLSLAVVLAANVAVFWAMAAGVVGGSIDLGHTTTFAQAAIGTALIAFGGLNWALDSAAAPVAAVLRLGPQTAERGSLTSPTAEHSQPSSQTAGRSSLTSPAADRSQQQRGRRGDQAERNGQSSVSAGHGQTEHSKPGSQTERGLPSGQTAGRGGPGDAGGRAAGALPVSHLRFREVSFAYPGEQAKPVLQDFDLTIPARSSLAIVGRNGAGKTTLAKLICRLYDPVTGAVEADGIDLRALEVGSWRGRLAAVFQDFIRFELSLRENVAPGGAPDEVILEALRAAGAEGLADLDTVLAKGYQGGTDLSGGQWQRIALARALCAVKQGAGVVLLDEPTAQLDVRGEAEIFERLLAETRHCTTILISHRFSTVRLADRICVLEEGRVAELGSHEELMALNGRYRTMFDLQAQRFAAGLPEQEAEEMTYDVLS